MVFGLPSQVYLPQSTPSKTTSQSIIPSIIYVPQSTKGETKEQSQQKYFWGVASGAISGSNAPVVVEKEIVYKEKLASGAMHYGLGKEVTTYTGITPIEQASKQSLTQQEQTRRQAMAQLSRQKMQEETLAARREKQVREYKTTSTSTTATTSGSALDKIAYRAAFSAEEAKAYTESHNRGLVNQGTNLAIGVGSGIVSTVGGLAGVSSRAIKGDVVGAAKSVFWEGPYALGGQIAETVKKPSAFGAGNIIGVVGSSALIAKGAGVGIKGAKAGIEFGSKVARSTMPRTIPSRIYGEVGEAWPARLKQTTLKKFPVEEPPPKYITRAPKEVTGKPRIIDVRRTGIGKMNRGTFNPLQTQEILERGSKELIDTSKRVGIETVTKLGTRRGLTLIGGTALIAGQGAIQAQKTKSIFEQKQGPKQGIDTGFKPAGAFIQKSSELIVPAITTTIITSSMLTQRTGTDTEYRYREETPPNQPKLREYRLIPGAPSTPGSSGLFGGRKKKIFGRETKYAPSVLGKLGRVKASKSFKSKPFFTGLEVRGV